MTSICVVESIWVLMTNSGPSLRAGSRIFGMMTLKGPEEFQYRRCTCHPWIDGRSRVQALPHFHSILRLLVSDIDFALSYHSLGVTYQQL